MPGFTGVVRSAKYGGSATHWREKRLDHKAHSESSSSSRDVAGKSSWIRFKDIGDR
ncbi:hypothetical protein TIFTF001_018613 [Ficus carica]|uniref:Uncharacterized protein n=1 Tax=Ficus carica TaxID=3494 RepID=A0AA88D9E5_FICCA|nr:hypothetical protein TIFTF001_018613 [Ficus carica]